MAGEQEGLATQSEAARLSVELESAYEGLKGAIGHFRSAITQAEAYMDDHDIIERAEGPGLDSDEHALYQLWQRMPDDSEVRELE